MIYIRFRSLQNIWIFPPKIVIFENSKMLQNETFWRFLPTVLHMIFLPIFYQFNGLVNWSYLIYDFLPDHCNSLFWAKSTKPKVPRVCHHRAVAKNKDVVPAKKLPLQPLPVEIMSWNPAMKTSLWIQIQPKIYPHKLFWKTDYIQHQINCQNNILICFENKIEKKIMPPPLCYLWYSKKLH